MNHILPILVTVFLVVLALAPAPGQEQPKDEKKYAPMPWHLVDTWWDIGHETPFESLAVDVIEDRRKRAMTPHPWSRRTQ